MKSKLLYVAIGVAVGIVFAPQVAKIPLINKLPQV